MRESWICRMASSIGKTQFVINGAPFETLLGQPPNDPLVLMLARGPAGFRFTAKALQHAMPDAKLERGESRRRDGDRVQAWPSELLVVRKVARDRVRAVNAVVSVTLRLAQRGSRRGCRSHGRAGRARKDSGSSPPAVAVSISPTVDRYQVWRL